MRNSADVVRSSAWLMRRFEVRESILLLDTLSIDVFGSLSVDLLDISVCQI